MHDSDRPGTRIEPSNDRRIGTDRDSSRGGQGATVERYLTGEPTNVETASLSATLVGVPRVPLESFVYDHQLKPGHVGRRRPMALFDVENTSARPVEWKSAGTTFVGTDDYTYSTAQLSVDPSAVGPGCHTRRVTIEPGRRARVVTLVEELPDGVDVDVVTQTLSLQSHLETTRLTFTVG